MNTKGRARRELIVKLAPKRGVIVDVGADHGHVAARIPGAIATERMPHRRGRHPIRWVIADGLSPFRRVDGAIIAGMGAKTIEGILSRGPRPPVAVLHAPDDPQRLRLWLGENGYRIDAEGLAPEGRAFAEVIRVVEGRERTTGLELAFGPLLLKSSDPHLVAHLTHLRAVSHDLIEQIGERAPDVSELHRERVAFLDQTLSHLTA